MASNSNDGAGGGCLGVLIALGLVVWLIQVIVTVLAYVAMAIAAVIALALACVVIYMVALFLWELAKGFFRALLDAIAWVVGSGAVVVHWLQGHDVRSVPADQANDYPLSPRTLDEGDSGPVFTGTIEDAAWLHATQSREPDLQESSRKSSRKVTKDQSGWESVSPHHDLTRRRIWY